jgi:hypothetical protein
MLYISIIIFLYIILKINNDYNFLNMTIIETYSNKKFYIINTQYKWSIYNFLIFIFSIYFDKFIFIVLLGKIINLLFKIDIKKENYIYNCNDILLYLVVLNLSVFSVSKYISIFALSFINFNYDKISSNIL